MNERIRELSEQCYNLPDTSEALYYRKFDEEKFAQLIVRAIFDKIEDERFEVYQPVKESVMKHFGVEL